MDLDESLLTSEDVAKYLHVDVVTVRRLVSRNELAAYRVGSEYRFSRRDLDEYLRHQYIPARPGAVAGIVAPPGPFGFVARALAIGIDVGRTKPKHEKAERFTARAAQALTHSDEIARQAHSATILPVHVLLGLLRVREGVAWQALHYFGVTEKEAHDAVNAATPEAAGADPAATDAPTLSPDVKQALQAAVAEANRLHHDYLGTEHLLLGLLRDEKGAVAELLKQLNAPAKRVRAQVLELIKTGGGH